MSDRTLLDRAAVARRLGISVEVFYRNQRTLFADGFPQPALGRMSGARWDPVAIDRWLDSKIASPAAATPADDDLDRWGAALDASADRLAEGTPKSRRR